MIKATPWKFTPPVIRWSSLIGAFTWPPFLSLGIFPNLETKTCLKPPTKSLVFRMIIYTDLYSVIYIYYIYIILYYYIIYVIYIYMYTHCIYVHHISILDAKSSPLPMVTSTVSPSQRPVPSRVDLNLPRPQPFLGKFGWSTSLRIRFVVAFFLWFYVPFLALCFPSRAFFLFLLSSSVFLVAAVAVAVAVVSWFSTLGLYHSVAQNPEILSSFSLTYISLIILENTHD